MFPMQSVKNTVYFTMKTSDKSKKTEACGTKPSSQYSA